MVRRVIGVVEDTRAGLTKLVYDIVPLSINSKSLYDNWPVGGGIDTETVCATANIFVSTPAFSTDGVIRALINI